MIIWSRVVKRGANKSVIQASDWRLLHNNARTLDRLKSLIRYYSGAHHDSDIVLTAHTGSDGLVFSRDDGRDRHDYRFVEGGAVVAPDDYGKTARRSVLQDWVMSLTLMQQSVLIAAMRGPDGVDKGCKAKNLVKWLRRCIVISAFDGVALDNPYHPGGGSYTGPSIEVSEVICPDKFKWELDMDAVLKDYLKSIDSLPLHYHLHFLHAVEILGYKHGNTRIRAWWLKTYLSMVHDMHLAPETEAQLDNRLDDNESKWRADETRFKK